MKYLKITSLFAIMISCLQWINAQSSDGYSLVWEDNFNGTELNKDNWVIEVDGNGGGNAELQYYRKENISVGVEPKSGANCLIITAKKEDYLGKKCTSGRLTTSEKMSFKYGKIQARIKLPKTANGLWPAFWMLGQDFTQVGWPKSGEIDILEMGNVNGINRGTQERYFSSWFHWGESWTPQGNPNWGKDYTHPTGIQDDFFLFTLIWDKNSLKTYFGTDDNEYLVKIVEMGINGPDEAGSVGRYFHKPYFAILNLAVGGRFTGITGNNNINKITALADGEAKMYVDYVKVFQKGDPDEEYYGPALNTSISPVGKENQYSIFPNPVDHEINIQGSLIPEKISIYDIKGEKIISKKQTRIVDVSRLSSGYYLVVIEDVNGRSESFNFLKK